MKGNAYIHTVSKMLSYTKGARAYLVLSLAMALLSVISTLFFPMLTGYAVDAISAFDGESFIICIAAMGAVALSTALFQFAMNIANNRLSYTASREIRKDVFRQIGRLPLSYLDSHPHGDIVSRMIGDVDQVSDGLLLGFTQLFTGVLTIAGTIICMFTVSWQVAVVVILTTPLSLFAASFIAKKTFTFFYRQSESRGEQTAFVDEMISASHTAAAFGMEKGNQDRFDDINRRWAHNSLLATFFSSLTNPVTRFVNSLVYMAVALSGGLAAVAGIMTIGGLSCILVYASQYAKPFNEISGVVTEFQNAVASADRIFRFLDEEKESDDSMLPDIPEGEGSVEFRNISFGYPSSRILINDFSIAVKPGMKVAIVGPTGAGKTTMINLLMRFYDPVSGTIAVDGHDYLLFRRNSLRKRFAMVLQDTWLKSGSIRDNLLLGNPEADDEMLWDVIRRCHLDGYISSLPRGLDEWISDESEAISAGQKQLISIARAMLAEPDMLILDEATSSVDTRTEALIQEAFDTLMKGRTSFVIAHRLSTIRNSDLILVMKDGNIIEKGTHSQLMAAGGFYSELYNSQFSH